MSYFLEIPAARTSEPQWLYEVRHRAVESFYAQGIPTRRQENWRYTDITTLVGIDFDLSPTVATSVPFVQPFTLPDQLSLVFFNGHFRAELSSPRSVLLEHGVVILPADFALLNTQCTHLFGSVIDTQAQPFAAHNMAAHECCSVIDVKSGKIPPPIHLYFIATAENKPAASYPYVLLRVSTAAKATIATSFLTQGTQLTATNALMECYLEPEAQLNQLCFQDTLSGHSHIGAVHLHQEARSLYHLSHVSLGNGLTRFDVRNFLKGSGASAEVVGYYHAGSQAHVDTQIMMAHEASETRSNTYYRGLADEGACAVFNGLIKANERLKKIEAHLINNNILLGKNAEINTKPELLIDTDDVQCSHGATVGFLDEEALFYLRSRGLSEEQAKQFLIKAFSDVNIHKMIPDAFRDYLRIRLFGENL